MDHTNKQQPSAEQASAQKEAQQSPAFERNSPENITNRAQIYALQRQIGNQALQRLLNTSGATVQRDKKRKADVLDYPSKRMKGMLFEPRKDAPLSMPSSFDKPFQYNFPVSGIDFGLNDKKQPRKPRFRRGAQLRLNSRPTKKQFSEVFMPMFSSSPFMQDERETMDLTDIGETSMGMMDSPPINYGFDEETSPSHMDDSAPLKSELSEPIKEIDETFTLDEEPAPDRVDTTPIPDYPIHTFTVDIGESDDKTPSESVFDDENALMNDVSMPFGSPPVPEMSLEDTMDEKEDLPDEDTSQVEMSGDKVGLSEGAESGSVSHTIYAGTYRQDDERKVPTLIIQSYPLPVGVFISEMGAHYRKFDDKLELSVAKKKPNVITTTKFNKFVKNESSANKAVKAANRVFAKTKKTDQLLDAEKNVAESLHPVIKATTTAAKGISEHYADPKNRPTKPKKRFTNVSVTGTGAKKQYYYLDKVSQRTERYHLEGLVASYETQPDYLKSGLERDHQPHNALVEMMSKLDEFSGRKIQQAAAGRSAEVMTIMLHHKRHAKGRTFGSKAGQLTREAKADIVEERKTLAGAIYNKIKAAYDTTVKLKKPNGVASKLLSSLKDARDSAKTAKTSGLYADLTETMDHLTEAGTYTAKAQFNGKKFANSDFDDAELLVKDYAEDMRKFCIELMVDYLKADVAAMKKVASKASNFGDVKALNLSSAKEKKLIQKIQDQINDGEDRMLSTKSVIRGYADK